MVDADALRRTAEGAADTIERLQTAIYSIAMAAETTSDIDVIRTMLRAANAMANPESSVRQPGEDQ